MMLARAASRSLRSPASRTPVRSSPIASAQWTRTLANNSPRGPPRKLTDYSKPPGNPLPPRPSSIGPQRSTGAAAAFHGPRSTNTSRSSDGEAEIQYSKEQDEISEKASPESTPVLQSEGGGSGTLHKGEKYTEDPAYSELQDKVKSAASPSGNTAPESTVSSGSDAAETQEPTRPLPDLTQGIPSTLEYETIGSTTAGRPEGASLNLTEDPTQGSGGRGRGELPASAYISSSERKRLKVANYMYATFAAASLFGYIYLGRNWESEDEERQHPDAPSGWALGLMWNRAKARTRDQLNYYNEPAFKKLLPDQSTDPMMYRPYTLVLSLEDLLVHSEWSRDHGWRMAKRPGVDYFLRYLNQYYELVIFTSVPWAMAEPVIKKLDPYHIVSWPLFREATLYKNSEYIKVCRSSHRFVLVVNQNVGSFVSESRPFQGHHDRYGGKSCQSPTRKRNHPSKMER
jgi:mitochondrial import inner membrane translocase subunit TIM50